MVLKSLMNKFENIISAENFESSQLLSGNLLEKLMNRGQNFNAVFQKIYP